MNDTGVTIADIPAAVDVTEPTLDTGTVVVEPDVPEPPPDTGAVLASDVPASLPDSSIARPGRAGAVVFLGDSISDGGGQAPFFYNLLVRNDDALFPSWRGRDLATRYPGIRVVHSAMSGSTTAGLVGQVRGLPNNLQGDVIVTVTSGGNDMKDAIVQVFAGVDAGARAMMAANLRRALDELMRPGRLGAGRAYLFEGNIYDASDGRGDYFGRCPFASRLPLTVPSDAYFARWNGVITDEVRAHGGFAVDMHGLFRGHGYASGEPWYMTDCTHPNRLGHHQLRRHFWQVITGESPPL